MDNEEDYPNTTPKPPANGAERYRWEGEITARVNQHDRILRTVDRDVRETRKTAEDCSRNVAEVQGQVREARDDIAQAMKDIRDTREEEMGELKLTITNSRNLIIGLVSPLIVAVVAGVIIFLITGSAHHAP